MQAKQRVPAIGCHEKKINTSFWKTGQATKENGRWAGGVVPPNVWLGPNTLITGDLAFKRFHSRVDKALLLGAHCTMDGVHFSVGENGRVKIGDYCYFTNVVLLCELELKIGQLCGDWVEHHHRDTDFHPIAPPRESPMPWPVRPWAKGAPAPP